MKLSLNRYNNLTQRVVVALVGVMIIIAAIIWSPWSYFVVFFILGLATILEFYKLTGLDGFTPLKTWGTMTGLFLYIVTFLIEMNLISFRYFLLVFPIATIIFFIKLYKKSDNKPFTNIAYTFLGIIYVFVPFSLLHVIAFRNGQYQYEVIIGILFLIWASDTGGYFSGTMFGRTKLFERVSPKKSWEGLVGGFVLTIVVAIAFSVLFDTLPMWKWIVMGVIAVISGTYGDLVESLFKRGIKIKDSGRTLPGHGGFLDRFDALLLSVPFMAPFILLF